MGHDPLVGSTIGHFRVLAPLGRGGVGVVYRAEDLDLWREVALKLLPTGGRYLREARAAAAVAHANVATIHEVGQDGDRAYIAMELVRGPTLRQLLITGLPRRRALPIAASAVLHRHVGSDALVERLEPLLARAQELPAPLRAEVLAIGARPRRDRRGAGGAVAGAPRERAQRARHRVVAQRAHRRGARSGRRGGRQRSAHAAAEACYVRAAAGARACGQLLTVAVVHNNLGVIAHEQGQLDRARASYQEAVHLLGRRGQPVWLGTALGNLAYVETEAGELRAARAHHDQAIALLADSGDRRYRATFLAARGALAADGGRLDDAARDLADADALAQAVGEPGLHVAVELRRGHLEIAHGDAEAARRRLAAVRAAGWVDRSDIVRMAVRLLEHTLAR